MPASQGSIELLEIWCREAVGKFGDNWPMIEAHIRKKLAELPENERKCLMQDIQLALAPLDDKPH